MRRAISQSLILYDISEGIKNEPNDLSGIKLDIKDMTIVQVLKFSDELPPISSILDQQHNIHQ